MSLTFPEGFLFGSAGSAHQTEGNNTNSDWWEHELAPDSPAAEPSGAACDSYNRFEEDWRLIAESGQNAVRFSIEWARIEPSPGEFSKKELDHYREVIGTARDLGLTTMVTLHHFTNPIWFARRGSWEAEEAVEVFARYTRTACQALGDVLENVNTINEPQIVAAVGWFLGYFPPRKQDLALAQRVTVNLIKAHAASAEEVRTHSGAKVGLPLSINDYVPADDTAEANQFRDFTHRMMVGVYLDALRDGKISGIEFDEERVPGLGGTDDFVGVQYYTRFVTDPAQLSEGPGSMRRAAGEGDRVTQMGWVWHPEGLGKVLDEVAEVGLPIYITENGIATEDDDERIEYITLHLEQAEGAIQRSVDVRGYFYWSYIDNFEWNEGYRPKFGLIAVDRETSERIPKPSLRRYGALRKLDI